MTDYKIDIHTMRRMIVNICGRPNMYVMNGTFNEVAAFINGFEMGAHVDPNLVAEWKGFTSWLQIKLDYSPSYFWCFILSERYPDGKVALEQLRSLYLEYLAELGLQKNDGV